MTARQHVAGGTRSSSLARNWPIVVIILSLVAIIAAVVLWVWPTDDASKKHASTKNVDLGPAPDRMNTDSLPPSPPPPPPPPRRADPPPPPVQTTPPPTQTDKGTPIEDQLDPQAKDPKDPWDSHTQIPDFNDLLKDPDLLANLDPRAGLSLAVLKHACTRAEACGGTHTTVCEAVANMPVVPTPACPAAQRCLDHIDKMTCGSVDPNAMTDMVQMSTDCSEAVRC